MVNNKALDTVWGEGQSWDSGEEAELDSLLTTGCKGSHSDFRCPLNKHPGLRDGYDISGSPDVHVIHPTNLSFHSSSPAPNMGAHTQEDLPCSRDANELMAAFTVCSSI